MRRYLMYFSPFTFLKWLTASVLFISILTNASAQKLTVIPHPASEQSLFNHYHQTDGQGNTYLLSSAYEFYGGLGFPIEGTYTFGTLITKLDREHKVVWEHLFPTAGTRNLTANALSGRMAAMRFYLFDSLLIVPYSYYDGLQLCTAPRDTFSGNSYQVWYDTYRNGLVLFDTSGLMLENKVFLGDTNCAGVSLISTMITNAGEVLLISRDRYTRSYFRELIDQNLKVTLDTNQIFYRSSSFSCDAKPSDNFWICSDSQVSCFSKYGKQLSSFQHSKDVGGGIGATVIGNNSRYVAISYARATDAYWLAIYTRDGVLVSFKKRPRFSYLFFDEHDAVWTTTSGENGEPVQYIQTDLRQNTLRARSLNLPYCYASSLSIQGDMLTISGTLILTDESYYPNKLPNRNFMYQEQLKPLHEAGNLCDELVIYPNPASGSLLRIRNDASSSESFNLGMYNALGQQVLEQKWSNSAVEVNVDRLPCALYYLKVTTPTRGCVIKWIK